MKSRAAGFTIIELMMVIAIVGVLAAIGIPTFNEMIRNNRRTTVVNEVLSNLMLARSEAVKRGQVVSVCGNTSLGGISCTGGTNWSYGWMVFLDPNNDGAIASTDDMITQYVNAYADIRVNTNGLTNSPSAGVVAMRPFSQNSTNGSVTVCDGRGATKARVAILANTGRAYVSDKKSDGSLPDCP